MLRLVHGREGFAVAVAAGYVADGDVSTVTS